MLVYYFVRFIVSNRYLLFWVSNGHNSVTVQNWTHVCMNFFDHKDLGNHLLQICPKVLKHPLFMYWRNQDKAIFITDANSMTVNTIQDNIKNMSQYYVVLHLQNFVLNASVKLYWFRQSHSGVYGQIMWLTSQYKGFTLFC